MRRLFALLALLLAIPTLALAQGSPTFASLYYGAASGGCAQTVACLNFTANGGAGIYSLNGTRYSSVTAIPGWSFTRASSKTALNSSGQIVSFASGVPAITDLGFLPEAAATNLLTQSQAFSNAAWQQVLGAAATDNQVAAPDGTLTGAALTFSSSNGNRIENDTATAAVNGTTVTASLWLKGSGTVHLNASTTTGVGGSGEIQITLTSTWTRYSVAYTPSAPTGSLRLMIIWRTGDTATACNAWGAQLETGSIATSYIPTTSSTATRAADVASIGGLSLTQATIAVMATPGATDSTFRRAVSLNDGTASNEAYIGIASGNAKGFVFAGGVQQAGFNGTTWTGSQKAALSYAAGAQAASYFGGAATTATGASAPTATHLDIGNVATSAQFDGYIQSVRVYTPPLSNSQLPGL